MNSITTGRPCVYILRRDLVSCPVSALWHSRVSAYGQSITATSTYRCDMTSDMLRCLKATLNPDKQIINPNIIMTSISGSIPGELTTT